VESKKGGPKKTNGASRSGNQCANVVALRRWDEAFGKKKSLKTLTISGLERRNVTG
jgi:hypothetical protein